MNGKMMPIGIDKARESEARESEVRNWLNRLETELVRSAELQDMMFERMKCVLRDEPPSCGSPAQPEEQLTPLAGEIRYCVRKLENMLSRYESLLDRIEL